MRILVAGGAGYVGSALVPQLLAEGHEVTVADLLWFGNHLPSAASVLERDVMDLSLEDLDGFETVIFLAGLSNDPMAGYSPRANFVGNAAAPALLAYLSREAGARRFIYASSCSVYGFTDDRVYDEDDPTTTMYPYGISKLQGELGVRQIETESYSVIALRKGTVCGYSPRMRLDLVLNTMFKTGVGEGVIRVHDPEIWRPILAVQDCVSAYKAAVSAPIGLSGVFNVASANYTLLQLGEAVQRRLLAGMALDVDLQVTHSADIRNYRVSLERSRRELGFEPMWNADRIVDELIEHLPSFQDFDDAAFYNIRTFKRVAAGNEA